MKPKDEPIEKTETIEESSQLRKLTGPENVFRFQQENGKIYSKIEKKFSRKKFSKLRLTPTKVDFRPRAECY